MGRDYNRKALALALTAGGRKGGRIIYKNRGIKALLSKNCNNSMLELVVIGRKIIIYLRSNYMNKEKIVAETIDRSELWQLCLLSLLAVVTYLYSDVVFAQGIISGVLCSVYGIIYYDVGRGLATLAILALGVGAMFGRVTWGQAVMVVSGIGVVFGALSLAFSITPTSLLSGLNSTICGIQGTVGGISSMASGGLSGFLGGLLGGG